MTTNPPEQSRAVYPHTVGTVDSDGIEIFYEVYGDGPHTVLLMPTWTFAHSRVWKAQIGCLSRHYRVVTFDPRGNGKSGRPSSRDAFAESLFVEDALRVMDATETRAAVVVTLSTGAQRGLLLAKNHPERVLGLVLESPYFIGTRSFESLLRIAYSTFDGLPHFLGRLLKWNGHYIKTEPDAFIAWFSRQMLNVPHSTKQIEDSEEWARQTTGDTIAESWIAELATPLRRDDQAELASRVRCPALVIHGGGDKVTPRADAEALAKHTSARFETIPKAGHLPHARKPAVFNRILLDFCNSVFDVEPPKAHRIVGRRDRPRALFVSSPIGLGHARRDLAISRALRALRPDVEVEWLSQQPVTTLLEREGEIVHAASAHLTLESAHVESEAAEHDLHCFQAWRRMDEIMIHNFGVFQELVDTDRYDLVVGDEAWDIDYFTHEHPNLKRAPFAWLTDFVGWLPMPEGGRREQLLTTDYNAEMIKHVESNPSVRDRAIFVGNPDDMGDYSFGPDLPRIREWTQQHYDFAGYVTGFDSTKLAGSRELRRELGYGDDEMVCIVTVGGSAVGLPLLRRVVGAYPLAKEAVPNLRMVVVAGPRIDRATLRAPEGVEVYPYVHGLHRHLAVCDLAIVQGGLTTTMELAATGRPFIYVPLRRHFEQQFWVRRRLERYAAGRHMAFEELDAQSLAAAISEEIGKPTRYRPVETNGAEKAASMIAELL